MTAVYQGLALLALQNAEAAKAKDPLAFNDIEFGEARFNNAIVRNFAAYMARLNPAEYDAALMSLKALLHDRGTEIELLGYFANVMRTDDNKQGPTFSVDIAYRFAYMDVRSQYYAPIREYSNCRAAANLDVDHPTCKQ